MENSTKIYNFLHIFKTFIYHWITMFKKSLFALFSCLIITGLFLAWNVDAFKYVASWNSNIYFDTDHFWNILKIEYGDPSQTFDLENCIPKGSFGKLCKITHDSNEYTITITFKNNLWNEEISFIHLELDDSTDPQPLSDSDAPNVIKILNYDWINYIQALYLSNNKNIDLNNVSVSNIHEIYIDSWNLDVFKLPLNLLNNNILTSIHFKHNKLTTIPENVRNNRDIYNIQLGNGDETIVYKNTSSYKKRIYLDDNPIKFVWITKVGDCMDGTYNGCPSYYINTLEVYPFVDTTEYSFSRFGYDYNNGRNTSYKYRILSGNSIISGWTTSAWVTGITFTDPLKPGDYEFQVCLESDDDDCDYNGMNKVNFSVDYDEDIVIDDNNPNTSSPYTSENNILWIRWRSWKYPKIFLSWYRYTITKTSNWNWSTEWFVNIDDLSNCTFNYHNYYDCNQSNSLDIGNIIWIKRSDPDGDYTLEVCLQDENWNIKNQYNNDVCEETDFTIAINNDFTITSPSDNETITELPINFAWYTTWLSFTRFEYYITTSNSCNNLNIVTWGTEYTTDVSFYESLQSWNYILCVTMFNGWNSTDKNVNFKVHKVPTLEISSPSSTETQEYTTFTWQWTLPSNYNYINSNGIYYEYTVKQWGTIKNSDTTWNGIVWENISFSLPELEDGNYSFTVTMHYTDNWAAHTIEKTVNFTRAISEHPHIDIEEPNGNIIATGVTQTGVLFKWNWWGTALKYYKYILKKSDATTAITEWTVQENWTKQFFYDLEKWDYIFVVTGYNSLDNPLTWASKNFSVTINSTLRITSPSNWANLTNRSNTFYWDGFTPNEFINYQYEIRKWGSIITWWTTNNINSNSRNVENLRDGNDYTFKVTMNYEWWYEIAEIPFEVNASNGVFLNITSPSQPTYTWDDTTAVSIDFTWTGWNSALIEEYRYKITNLDTNTQVTWWTVNKNIYSIPGTSYSLPSGRYKFEVTMLDDENNPIIDTWSFTFNVVIPPHLKINTPPAWQLTTKNVTFTWSGFAEFGHHYKYIINRVDPTTNTIISELTWNNNSPLNKTWFTIDNIHNGKYIFTVYIMDNTDHEIINDSQTFRIPDDKDLILDISDWNTSITNTLRSSTWVFTWWWKSEDFHWYYYSITGTTSTGAYYTKTWTTVWNTTWELNLELSSWKYRFYVKMLDENNEKIIDNYKEFNVEVPARLKITYPNEWASLTSRSATFTWTWYSDVITRYEYNLAKAWANIDQNNITNTTSFSRTNLGNWDYTLTVRISSWGNLVASDTINFTVAVKSWWWSSSKSHTTNNLSVSVANDSPKTNERVEVVVDIDDKYTWKVDFTKMQVYSGWKWVDIPITSKNYVSDYSDDAKLWYVKFSSDDDWEKELSQFIMFNQTGNYRLYAEDKDWYNDYTEFYIWNWKTTSIIQTNNYTNNYTNDDDVYIARSCKKYKIKRYDSLQVYSSPNLLMNEYFVNKEYFKRYIDSKNKYQDGCPTNIWWISTSYYDSSNSNTRYTAPNGKVYFIVWKEWNYYSNELNKELKTPTSFNTIEQLKTYIRDRNPLINMAALWPVK